MGIPKTHYCIHEFFLRRVIEIGKPSLKHHVYTNRNNYKLLRVNLRGLEYYTSDFLDKNTLNKNNLKTISGERTITIQKSDFTLRSYPSSFSRRTAQRFVTPHLVPKRDFDKVYIL